MNFKEIMEKVIENDITLISENAKQEIAKILNADKEAAKLKALSKKEDSKIVDFIDYMFGKHENELDDIMQAFKLTHDKMVSYLVESQIVEEIEE